MRFRGEEDAEIVDGQVTARQESPLRPAESQRQQIYQVDPSYVDPQGQGFDATGALDVGVGFATDSRARTIALLVKVPLFAYVALNGKLPPIVRLVAAGLGVMEALEAIERQPELESMYEQGF